LGLKIAPATHQWVKVRYAAAYPKLVSASALGFEKGAWHTRLEAVFALYFHFLGAFFAAEPQKTGLSAPIPRPAYGGTAGFPLQSRARGGVRKRPPLLS
jgi:hypothetical protein